MTEKKETFETSWEKMSSEEKKMVMKKMMEECFSGMTGDEVHGFMHGMMDGEKGDIACHPMDMMGKMMSKGGINPMEMMSKMMGGKGKEGGFNPMEMCSKMMSFMHENRKLSTLATPEVQGLFEDWVEQIEEEIIEFVKDKKDIQAEQVAEQFKISKDSAYYFLTQLAKKGKINLKFGEKQS